LLLTVLPVKLVTIQELVEEVQALEEAVQSAVQEGKLARQVHQVTMEAQEKAEHQEAQEMLDDHQLPLANRQLHHHVTLVPLDHQDHQVHQEPQETPDQTVIQVKAEATHNQAHQDQKDHQDHQVQMETQAHPAAQDNQLNHKTQAQDNLDQPEMPDHQDHQDQQASQASQVDQEPQDQKDQTEIQEPQEMMVNRVNQDQQDNQEALVRKEFVQNTAQSMEESSLKMEPDVVKSVQIIQRYRSDLPKIPCPMNQQFPFVLLVAQKTAIYYVSLLYCIHELGSIFGLTFSKFFLK